MRETDIFKGKEKKKRWMDRSLTWSYWYEGEQKPKRIQEISAKEESMTDE